MRKIIVGKCGTGKTTLIVKEIIPEIEDYLVLDFLDEYSQWIDKNKIKYLDFGLSGKELKQRVTTIIQSTSDDTVLIIDSTAMLCFSCEKRGDTGYLWLRELLKTKKFILVFQSIKSLKEIGWFPYFFKDFYLFPTNDNILVTENYYDNLMEDGINLIIKPDYARNND